MRDIARTDQIEKLAFPRIAPGDIAESTSNDPS
jgi:hypothetical protein